ncbi:MAG: formimidoylglutamate deiminase [Flavobacteriaceae bacterium]|nr:formimidoylglutamate deiminase [Flavobacteriaceae bacterium]
MTTYNFKKLLQKSGWLTHVQVMVDDHGLITSITTSEDENGFSPTEHSIAIPGFQNAHSHAFQYAMAGLAERHEGSENPDDFWGWREAMYQLALSMNPDQMEAIATMLYSEMARHGYTNVAEFHYVHHDKNGKPYANLAEMGTRLIAAAQTAGIGITLCPIFYQKGGFGQEPNDRQRRFISPTIDTYLQLLESSREACKNYEHANSAIGIHSMRGVEPADIAEIAQSGPQDIPFHIHVSEQLKEIEDSIAYLGKRPVEWMLDNVALNERYHLVHATHLTETETKGLAQSGAHVVICPSTEGNLGDGLFPLRKYQQEGGKWSIGTDSHVGLNPLEELRILDYGQRLISHKRNTYFSPQQGDGGTYALEMATLSGRKAMNNDEEEYFKVGTPLNAFVVDGTHPLLAHCSDKNLASTLVYASDSAMQKATISHGKVIVENGKHACKDEILNEFSRTMNTLRSR